MAWFCVCDPNDPDYVLIEGKEVNDYFGISIKLDESFSPFLIFHLDSGTALVWTHTVDNGEVLIHQLTQHFMEDLIYGVIDVDKVIDFLDELRRVHHEMQWATGPVDYDYGR